jgi:hypothetical protein
VNQISGTNLVLSRTKLTLQSLVRKLQHTKRRLTTDPKQAVKIISDVEEYLKDFNKAAPSYLTPTELVKSKKNFEVIKEILHKVDPQSTNDVYILLNENILIIYKAQTESEN